MGDTRYRAHYERVKRAADPLSELDRMEDDDLIQALAGGSADVESQYFMNVLASEALNRVRRARIVQQHIAEGVCALDGQGRVSSANPAAQRMLGFTEAELRGKLMYKMCGRYAAGDHDHVCAFMRVFEDGTPVDHSEERFLRADGSAMDVAYTAAPILADGAVAGAVVAFRDVGGALVAKRHLEESEARYRSLFENSADLIISVDLEGRVTALNPAGVRLTGYDEQALRGMRILPFIRAEDQARARGILRRVLDGETERDEFEALDAKGRPRLLEVMGVPIVVDGSVVGMHGVARDVTRARKTEAQLRASEISHRVAAEGLRDEAVVTLSPQGAITSWSRGASDLLGWTSAQVLGAPYAMLFAPDEATTGVPERELSKATRLGEAPIDESRRRADGGTCLARGALRCVRHEGGAVAGFALVLRADRPGVLVVRGDIIESASVEAAEILVRPAEALRSTPLPALLSPEASHDLEDALSAARRGETPRRVHADLLPAGDSPPARIDIDAHPLAEPGDAARWVLLLWRDSGGRT
jgi:PAS domain S-box-containing protein